jgi:hypothetical protein
MKVMMIVKATKESEAGVMPDEKTITEMGKFKEELVSRASPLSAPTSVAALTQMKEARRG